MWSSKMLVLRKLTSSKLFANSLHWVSAKPRLWLKPQAPKSSVVLAKMPLKTPRKNTKKLERKSSSNNIFEITTETVRCVNCLFIINYTDGNRDFATSNLSCIWTGCRNNLTIVPFRIRFQKGAENQIALMLTWIICIGLIGFFIFKYSHKIKLI